MNNIFRTFLLYISLILSFGSYLNAQSDLPELILPQNYSAYQRSKNLEFKWNEISSVTTYRFELSTDTLFTEPFLVLDVIGNTLTIDLLEYNTTYHWRVRCIDDTLWSEKWSFTTTIPPGRPSLYYPDTNLRNQADSMRFVWNSKVENTGYFLQLSFYPDFETVQKNVYVSDTTITIRSLLYNHGYYWRVRALNANFDESQWSEIRNFRTRLPIAFSADKDSIRNVDTSHTLRWTKIDSADYYAVRISDDPDLVTKSKSIIVNSNQVFLDSLENNKWYYWQVLSFNSRGDSSIWSAVYCFRTKLHNMVLTSPLKALRNTDTSVTFIWQPVQFAVRYHYQLAYDQQFSNPIIDTVLVTFSLHVDSLQYSRSYFWRINASNNDGDSSMWSEPFQFRTRLSVPQIILPVNDTNDVSVNPELRWSLSEGATHYHFQVSNESLFDYPLLDTTITRNSYKLSKLIPDTIYYWKVIAFNASKDSSLWTKIQKFRTSAAVKISTDSLRIVKNLSEDPGDTLGYIAIENSGINSFDFESLYLEPDSLFQLMSYSNIVEPGSSQKCFVRINTSKIPAGDNLMYVNLVRRNLENIPDTVTLTKNIMIRKSSAQLPADTILFRNTSALDSSLQKFVIKNIKSNIPLIIKKISFEGTDTLSFRLGNKLNFIPANDSLPLNIWFAPNHKNLNNAYLNLETNSFPVRNYKILLQGYGKGGELASETYSSVAAFAADSFETFTDNSRSIFFGNAGNDLLNISLRFKRNYFKTLYEFQKDIQLKPGDTTSVRIKYNTPNFRESNIDTLIITHRGFGTDTIIAVLKGTFDSTASSQRVVTQLLLNNERYSSHSKYLEKHSQLSFTHHPDLFTGMPNMNLRLKYFRGGNGSLSTVYSDNSRNFIIPSYDISEKGILIWGELIIRNDQYKIVDSLVVLPPSDFQVILRNYTTVPISVPRSIPAEDKESAKTKWVMFGFPFNETIADSVFGYFGGIQNQKDADWIIYEYNPQNTDQFSGFNSYSFEPLKGYFFAQSILDTFRITYKYINNVATRKLTDTTINVPGEGWRLISNPYLFDVEVDKSVTLMKYDFNYNSYRMVNFMKPGEAYFVEPSVNQLKIKTYGKYDPLAYPGSLNSVDWHLKITGTGAGSVNEVYVSVDGNQIAKRNYSNVHSLPPALNSEMDFFIRQEPNEKLQMSISQGKDGAVWDLIVRSKQDQELSLRTEIFGNFPKSYKYKLYDINTKRFIDDICSTLVIRDQEHIYKIIVGTEQFINAAVNSLNEIPDQYYLSQNYPNPFNSSTTVTYNIPSGSEMTKVELKLYDILGREVITLVEEYQSAGRYEVRIDLPLSTGVYIYKLIAGNFTQSHKMLLLK